MTMRLLLAIIASLFLVTSADAKIKRSTSAKTTFKKLHPCPATVPHSKTSCPGWVIDHIKALDCGGADAPSNMQWQTVADAKAKDKWERKGCSNGNRQRL